MGASAEVAVTGQGVRGETQSSKFEEYRTVPNGVFVEKLSFSGDYEKPNIFLELEGSRLGLDDQRAAVRGGRYGLFDASIRYDQTPHVFSNTGKSLYVHDGGGNLYLPNQVQTDLQTSTNNAPAVFSDVPFTSLKYRRDTVSGNVRITPMERLSFRVSASQENRNGTRPFGVAFGHGSIVEVPEPISYRTQDVSAGVEFANPTWSTAFNYSASVFNNDIDALTVDNPWRLMPSAITAAGASTPDRAQIALPPDNQSHNFSLSGGANLPVWSGRLNGLVSYGWMSQNDTFLPTTINQAILSRATFLSSNINPPRTSLEGQINILNANSSLVLRPIKPLTLTAKVRYYQLDNRTPELLMNSYSQYDATLSTSSPSGNYNPALNRRSSSIGYTKLGAGSDANVRVLSNTDLIFAYFWEQITRERREVHKTNEHTASVAVNFTPRRWVSLRPSALHAIRTYDNYSAHHVAEQRFPLGEGVNQLGQLDELRKFDEANRVRNQAALKGFFYPFDALTIGTEYLYRFDDYDGSQYGTTGEQTHSAAVNATYDVTEDWSFYWDFAHETVNREMRSRYREPGTIARLPYDWENSDWVGKSEDFTDTIGVGARGDCLKRRLGLDAGYSYSRSVGRMDAYNPENVLLDARTGGANIASQWTSANVIGFPETLTESHRATAGISWKFLENLTCKVKYEYEHYLVTDWSFDNIQVWQPVWAQSVFLDASQGSYFAHIASLSLIYKFN